MPRCIRSEAQNGGKHTQKKSHITRPIIDLKGGDQ